MKHWTLWYQRPATCLHECLPIGNGRIGAMVYGGALEERAQIDESTFWSGCAAEDNDRPGMKELGDKLRRLLLEKRFDEADRLGHDYIGKKGNYGACLPVGTLITRLDASAGEAVAYQRSLDLNTAVAETRFRLGNMVFVRESFVSNPDRVFVQRTEALGGRFTVMVDYEGFEGRVTPLVWQGAEARFTADALETLHSDGHTGARLAGCARVRTDGVQSAARPGMFENATWLEVLVDMQTNRFGAAPERRCKENLDAACALSYEALRERHIGDHAALFDRVAFELDAAPGNMPTDERLRRYQAGDEDNDLLATLFHFGRYLLIAGSRADSPLPTHMGGIWNDNIYCHEDCSQDMHIDMNVEMQYWLADPCDLQECAEPLKRWLTDAVMPSGRRTARETYGARGFTAHVVSNAWGFTALGWAYNWGVWAMGGAWLATMMWSRYLFSGDTDELKTVIYPVLREAALFLTDYLFENPETGEWMTGPSYSPENHYGFEGNTYCLCVGNTNDVLMAREVFNELLTAASLVGERDVELLARVRERLDRLPPYCVGKYGQIQEWYWDFDEVQPGHRHTSHLLGLYPFRQIVPERDAELVNAARVSLKRRFDNCEMSSWTMAFFISYYARLAEGDAAEKMLRHTLQTTVTPALQSTMGEALKMWGDTWEMDGNTGLTSAMCEMLVQTLPGDILWLLPALPQSWSNGTLRGLCAEGGLKVDIAWIGGKLTTATLHARKNVKRHVRCGDRTWSVALRAGESQSLDM